MKKYLTLLLFFGMLTNLHSQTNNEKGIGLEIRTLNVKFLKEMISQFDEKYRDNTINYPNLFEIPEGTEIKKSNTGTEWRYGNWSIEKEDRRNFLSAKEVSSINADDGLFWLSATSETQTDYIEFSILFTPNRQKYQIIDDMLTSGSYAPVPIQISLLNLKADYQELEKGTNDLYYEVDITNEKIDDKKLEQVITFLLENISDEFSQSILYKLLDGEIDLSQHMRKKIFQKGTDTMKILICRCKDLDPDLIEWCDDVEDEFR